jgi:hypothetical protein
MEMDYLAFLKQIDRNCDKAKGVPIVADKYSTHKTKEITEYGEGKMRGLCYADPFIVVKPG